MKRGIFFNLPAKRHGRGDLTKIQQQEEGGRGITLQTYGGEIKSLVCQFEIFSLVILKHLLKILIYCSILAQ